jgi:hypothetical protein
VGNILFHPDLWDEDGNDIFPPLIRFVETGISGRREYYILISFIARDYYIHGLRRPKAKQGRFDA